MEAREKQKTYPYHLKGGRNKKSYSDGEHENEQIRKRRTSRSRIKKLGRRFYVVGRKLTVLLLDMLCLLVLLVSGVMYLAIFRTAIGIAGSVTRIVGSLLQQHLVEVEIF